MIKDKSNLISVIIPVYKVEKYLDKCVESITKQTEEDIEMLSSQNETDKESENA